MTAGLRICPNGCSGHGSCAVPEGEPLSVRAAWDPVCTCDSGYTGFDCSLGA